MRWLALCALLAASGCEDSLDLRGAGDTFPFPRAPGGGTPTATPSPTPYTPGSLPDDIGDGHSGDLVAMGAETVNLCSPVTSASATSVQLGAAPPAGVAAGDRVLVWQVQDTFAVQGDVSVVTSPGGAGLFELGRIASIAGSSYTLTTALANGYTSGIGKRAQACTVPEYVNATVFPGGSLSSTPWDGTTGGVVALFAQNLAVSGAVTVDGDGFRGGAESSGAGGGSDQQALETSSASGGGKAEGLDPSGFGRFGRGNFANAAGGGNSRNAGGGGGGSRGAGGSGGRQVTSLGVIDGTRGMPGAAVLSSDLRFVMGGGGGGGHQNDGLQSDGGRGGGLILLFAQNLFFNGSISADGEPGTGNGADGNGDGGGGGGAGGMIVLLVENDSGPQSGVIRARGGDGGTLNDSTDVQGPGGGGGGGFFLTDSTSLVDSAVTSGGVRGLNFNADPNGAEDGAGGASELYVP